MFNKELKGLAAAAAMGIVATVATFESNLNPSLIGCKLNRESVESLTLLSKYAQAKLSYHVGKATLFAVPGYDRKDIRDKTISQLTPWANQSLESLTDCYMKR